MIHITATADRELKRLAGQKSLPKPVIRFGLADGGCAGWIYTVSFEQAAKADDAAFPRTDYSVVVAPRVLPYLDGTTIDYAEDLMGGNFRFSNPNAAKTCGCGTSFTLNESSSIEACAEAEPWHYPNKGLKNEKRA